MQLKSFRRAVVFTLTSVALVGASGCFGSFNTVRKLYAFNKTVSPNKFVREVVFLAFNIVPVYGVSALVDAVVANSVEFWTGTNPIQVDKETSIQRVVFEKNGTRFMTIEVFKSGAMISTTTMQMVGDDQIAFETVLANGRRISDVVRMGADGEAFVTGEKFQH